MSTKKLPEPGSGVQPGAEKNDPGVKSGDHEATSTNDVEPPREPTTDK